MEGMHRTQYGKFEYKQWQLQNPVNYSLINTMSIRIFNDTIKSAWNADH